MSINRPRLVVGALLLLAALIRSWHLDWMSIWQDEGLSLYRATKDLDFILSGRIQLGALPTHDLQPPLYFLLLAGWFRVVGVSTWTAKWLSLLAGLPTLPLVWALGRRWIGPRTGLIAASLVAISPVYLWYSQEIRSYTLTVTLGLLAVYALDRALAGTAGRQQRLLWAGSSVVANAMLIWTHYLGFLLLAFEALIVIAHFLRGRSRGGAALPAVPLAILALVMGLVALPLAPLALQRLGLGAETDQKFVPLPLMLWDVVHGFTFGWTGILEEHVVWVDAVDVAVIAVVVAGLGYSWRRRRSAALLPAGYLLVPVVGLFAITLAKPVYMGVRHILLASPAFYMLAAAGLVGLARHRRSLALPAVVLVTGAMLYADHNFYADPDYRKDELRGLAQYVTARAVPGDVLAVSDPRLVLAFEHLLGGLPVVAVPDMLDNGELDKTEPRLLLAPLLADHTRLWFMTPLPEMRQWLEATDEDGRWRNAQHVDRHFFQGRTIPVGVEAYERLADHVGAAAATGVRGGTSTSVLPADRAVDLGGLRLIDWRVTPDPLVVGRAGRVGLRWQVDRPVPEYKVALRLLDPAGRDFAQGDHAPFHGLLPTSKWPLGALTHEPHDLLLSPATPAGRYRLALTVYDPAAGTTYPTDAPFVLGEVEVVRPSEPIPPQLVAVGHRLSAVGAGLEVFGYELPDQRWQVGQRLPLQLWLRVRQVPVRASAVRLELADRPGHVVASRDVPLAAAGASGNGPQAWAVGDLRLLPGALDLPPVAGRFSLRFAVLGGDGNVSTVTDGAATHSAAFPLPFTPWGGRGRGMGGDLTLRRGLLAVNRVWLCWLQVDAPPLETEVPGLATRLDLAVGDAIELVGYDLPLATVAPGAVLPVTLYWRALASRTVRYRVTVQVLPAGIDESDGQLVPTGEPVAQHDGLPAQGTRPTTGWRTGEVIVDRHEVVLPPDLAAGDYLIITALHDPTAPEVPRPQVMQAGRRQDYAVLRNFVIGASSGAAP